MPAIPLLGFSKNPLAFQASSVTRKNCYAEVYDDADRARIAIYKWQGLSVNSTIAVTTMQGIINTGDSEIYIVADGKLYLQTAGVPSFQATLTGASGTAPAYLAFNGFQILIVVQGSKSFIWNKTTSVLTDVTATIPVLASSCTCIDGFFVVSQEGTGQFNISAINNGLSWNALDFATAESEPDLLQRVATLNGGLLLFGNRTLEFWRNTGAADFPFQRVETTQNQYGMPAKCKDTLAFHSNVAFFMALNRAGLIVPVMTDGYTVEEIAPPEFLAAINTGTLAAVMSGSSGLCYSMAGHVFYQLNFPNLLGGTSYAYDLSTKIWSQITDTTGVTSTYRYASPLLNAFGNIRQMIFPVSGGVIKYFDAAARGDGGNAMPFEITTKSLSRDGKRITLSSLEIDCTVGDALSAPGQVTIEVSRDSGVNFGTPIPISLGSYGQTKTRAVLRRLGASRDWTFRIKNYTTDKVSIFGLIVNEV